MYTLKVAAGTLIGMMWLRQCASRAGFDRKSIRLWICGATLVALISGRLGYALGNTAYFAQHPSLLLRLERVGGLHGSSAMIGALLVVGLWSSVAQQPMSMIVNFLSPAVLCVTAGAWWGCVDTGSAWGREVLAAEDPRWFTALLPDIYQTVTLRYAVQPIGAVWGLMLASLAMVLRRHKGLILALYWLGSAGLTLLRADPIPLIIVSAGRNVRLDTVLDLALAIGIALVTIQVGRTFTPEMTVGNAKSPFLA